MVRVLGFFLLFCGVAEARVFSFSNYSSAAYFRATGGMLSSGDQFYSQSSGASTAFRDDVELALSGELGFKFALNPQSSLRVGVEFAQTKSIEVTGRDGSATPLMAINSRSTVVNPNVTLEMNFSTTPTSKNIFFLTGGFGTITSTNSYSLTNPAGTTAYPLADENYKEVVIGDAVTARGGFATEFLFVDNVTLLLELGYQYLYFGDLTHKDAVSSVNGSKAKGEIATNNNGASRSLDMSGGFIGLSFRFYIPPLN